MKRTRNNHIKTKGEIMENLHLKNLTKTDIVTATLRYIAAIQQKNKKNEVIYEKQINDYFTLPKQFDIKNDFHLANTFHHITTLIKLINLNRNYYNNNMELALRKEIYKYFKNIKEYENRIVPQVEEIHKQPTNNKQLEELEIAYANYMYVDKSFIPEIKQIIDILNIYAKHNNKTKEDIIKIYKECCGYYNKHKYVYLENLEPNIKDYNYIYSINIPIKELSKKITHDELLDQLIEVK